LTRIIHGQYVLKRLNDIVLPNKSSQSYGASLPYGIIQCYLPPDTICFLRGVTEVGKAYVTVHIV